LAVVKELMQHRTPVPAPGLPRFTGGAVGYFGYDLVRFMERLPATAKRELDVPDMVLLMADNLVVFDHVRHRLLVIANMRVEGDLRAAYADAVARIDQIIADLRKPLVPPPAARTAQRRSRGSATARRPSTRQMVTDRPRSLSPPATSSR
jgi:anthranilate synthase component 1